MTLISGVLLYKNLTILKPTNSALKLDFDELRTIDQELINHTLYLRKNYQNDSDELESDLNRTKEFLALVNDINKANPLLNVSIEKIKKHFNQRLKDVTLISKSINELRNHQVQLLPSYHLIEKKNLKYILDKRDFYRECLLDAYMYMASSHKENEQRLTDDLKILSQIIAFNSNPEPEIQSFLNHLEGIYKNVKVADKKINQLREDNIETEMKIIAKYYAEDLQSQNEQNENLLTFILSAIAIYILFMIFILRKH